MIDRLGYASSRRKAPSPANDDDNSKAAVQGWNWIWVKSMGDQLMLLQNMVGVVNGPGRGGGWGIDKRRECRKELLGEGDDLVPRLLRRRRQTRAFEMGYGRDRKLSLWRTVQVWVVMSSTRDREDGVSADDAGETSWALELLSCVLPGRASTCVGYQRG
ncbi:hypothetical protein BDP81DRAFT_50277 [Colletotrichum phormii]|uniref:Uncharacterized protein n=1 Tax=Colletotrichum phormii TaxID=359342 RepID=A0AAI9ZPV0_9PEZI|nr:uncharacterized protein BDP81DRAFT_50277 [Colletotrichum phormii]KAK1634604.1 hypothetical protein BDP81DRAFT_50277 [Colletotrichum phormii]